MAQSEENEYFQGVNMDNKFSKLLASGTASDVYEYGSDKVCKLYFDEYNFDMVEWRYKKILEAYKIGLPTPKVYELIEHGGRFGIVIERFYGKNFYEALFSNIQASMKHNIPIQKILDSLYEILSKQAKYAATVLFEIHRIKCKLFFTAKELFTNCTRDNNNLSQNEKNEIFKLIEKLPDSDSICHGDPNLTNFICNDNSDKVFIVDWDNCMQSSPLYDITRYIVGTARANPAGISGVPDDIARFYSAHTSDFIKIFLDEYIRFSSIDLSDIELWITLLPVSWGSNVIGKEERQRLLEIIRNDSRIV